MDNVLFNGDTSTETKFKITDLDHPMTNPQSFDTFEQAKEVLNNEYTNRNKGDGHDEYWRRRRTGIVKVTTTIEVVHDNQKIIKNPL